MDVDLRLQQAAADHADPSSLIGNFHGDDGIDRGGHAMLEENLVRGGDSIDDEPDDGMIGAVHDGESVNENIFAGEVPENFA